MQGTGKDEVSKEILRGDVLSRIREHLARHEKNLELSTIERKIIAKLEPLRELEQSWVNLQEEIVHKKIILKEREKLIIEGLTELREFAKELERQKTAKISLEKSKKDLKGLNSRKRKK